MPLVAGLENILKPEVLVLTTGDVVELREKSRDVDMRVKVIGLPAIFVGLRMEGVGGRALN